VVKALGQAILVASEQRLVFWGRASDPTLGQMLIEVAAATEVPAVGTNKLAKFLFLCAGRMLQSCPPFKCTDL
jgi:hypothetical protein